ncbi:hypothetical protein YC2023_054380 [Brassica napus]
MRLLLLLFLSATSLSLVFSSIFLSVKSINKDSSSLLFLLLSLSINHEIRSENQKRKQIYSDSELHVMMKKVTKTEKRRGMGEVGSTTDFLNHLIVQNKL